MTAQEWIPEGHRLLISPRGAALQIAKDSAIEKELLDGGWQEGALMARFLLPDGTDFDVANQQFSTVAGGFLPKKAFAEFWAAYGWSFDLETLEHGVATYRGRPYR